MAEMWRPLTFILAIAASTVVNAQGNVGALDCQKLTPAPSNTGELIVSPVTLDERVRLRDVLEKSGLNCVAQFEATGDCLVRYPHTNGLEPRIAASWLRRNIHAFQNGAFNAEHQSVIGEIFVNEPLKIERAKEDEAVMPAEVAAAGNDPRFVQQEHLKALNVELAWTGKGENLPIVAVLDEGVWLDHPDLKENLKIPGKTFPCAADAKRCDGWPTKIDEEDHGTKVAGVIGAVGGNLWGIVGAGSNPQIIPINIGVHGGTDASVSCGVEYALKNGATVINASWDHKDVLPELRRILLAAKPDVVFVAAAGSGKVRISEMYPRYPLLYNLPNVIGVAALRETDEPLMSSNYSPQFVHITAQARTFTTRICESCTQDPNDKRLYGYERGQTSFSAAYVSSMVALLKTRYPNWSHEWLKWRIIEGAIFSQRLKHMSESQGRLDFASIMLPVKTTPDKVGGAGTTMIDWKKGIRSDMCPDVSIQARIGEPGNMGQYTTLIHSTVNDGEEPISAAQLASGSARQVQFLVTCNYGEADALSPPIDFAH
jgi:hypothetical protein